jgi:hypothetical protein
VGTMTRTVGNFRFQMAIWGYAVETLAWSRGMNPAIACERPGPPTMLEWDDPVMLDATRLNGSRPPDWFALWWVAEHVRRGHAAVDAPGHVERVWQRAVENGAEGSP